MVQQLREIMTGRPVTLHMSATVLDAARAMADTNIGSVLVVDDEDALRGLITDRDIIVRVVATARRLDSTTLAEVCTEEVATLSASDSVSAAIRLMSEHAVRRVPVMSGGKPVGIVSLGDVVLEEDPLEEGQVLGALADISAATPDDPSTEARPNATAGWEATFDLPPMPTAEELGPARRPRVRRRPGRR